MEILLSKFSGWIVQYAALGVFLALAAGIVASMSPCTISAISLVVSYNKSFNRNRRKLFFDILLYALGLAITTTVIVILFVLISATMESFAHTIEDIWLAAVALLMVFMALNSFGLFNKLRKKNKGLSLQDAAAASLEEQIVAKHEESHNNKHECTEHYCKACENYKKISDKKSLNSFLLGLFGGLMCAPCMAPIVLATVGVVSATKNVGFGTLIYVFYLIGHLAVIISGAMFFSWFEQVSAKMQNKKWRIAANIILGIIFIAFAAILISHIFTHVH